MHDMIFIVRTDIDEESGQQIVFGASRNAEKIRRLLSDIRNHMRGEFVLVGNGQIIEE